jgi:hypothetical protein
MNRTQIGSELRQSARRLLRDPGFTAAALLPLAIGLAAAATVFTLVHDVVLAPLPYPESDRLVVIRSTLPGYEIDGRVPEIGVVMGQYLHYRERSRSLDELGGYWTFDATLSGDEGAEYVPLGGATPGLWRVLGIRPVEGRLFREDDPAPITGGQGVTLLGHGFWAARYGDASALGRTMTMQGWTYQNAVERGRLTPRILPLRGWVLSGVERTLWLLFASVLLLLLVALANVAGLSLVRADHARRELAVRLALGSGRRGLALRMLMENVVLVGTAALLGLAFARIGVAAATRAVPTEIPRIDTVALGGAEAAFVMALAFVCVVVLAAVQFLRGRKDLLGALHDAGRGTAAGSTRLRLRHAFVGLQVALALVLAIGAGLIVRSAWSLGRTDPGFPVEALLTFRVPFPFGEVQAAGKLGTTATPFYEELTRRLEALPGVEAAGWGSCAPLSRFCDSGGFATRRPDGSAEDEDPAASLVQVSPGYTAALGIRLLEGRELTVDDYRGLTNRVRSRSRSPAS